MEVGRRVLVPEAFGFEPKYVNTRKIEPKCVEMRKIGPHPCVLPYAVILGFLEQAPISAPDFFNSAMRTLKLNTYFPSWANELASATIDSAEFAPEFVQKCNFFLESNRISSETDDYFQNIETLAKKLLISVSLNLGKFEHLFGTKYPKFTLYIGVHQRVCFLLYQELSKESLVILPCGHLQLRYKLMESLQRAARNYAISSTDAIEPAYCSDCDSPHYTPELFTFAESLARGEYILTVPQQLHPLQSHSLICVLCNRPISALDCAFSCECSETVCMQCMAISRLIAEDWKCPACHSPLQPSGHLDMQISQFKNLHTFLPRYLISTEPAFPQPQVKKKCTDCERILEIRHYLRNGEHMNCWVCDVCIKKNLKKRERNCVKCGREYSAGMVAQLEEVKTCAGMSNATAEGSKPISLEAKMGKGATSINPVQTGEKYTNCSRCSSTVILSTLHQCRDGKVYCSHCCIEDIIMTCTDDDIRCRFCRQPYANLDADVSRKQYTCSGCKKLKLLKEISHLCQNETYYCWKCVQMDMKNHRIFCNLCNFNVNDKYFLQRRGQNQSKKT